MNQREVLAKADVVIMNNVFEFFLDTTTQQKIWDWMIKVPLKKGCKIVTIPSLKENFVSRKWRCKVIF